MDAPQPNHPAMEFVVVVLAMVIAFVATAKLILWSLDALRGEL